MALTGTPLDLVRTEFDAMATASVAQNKEFDRLYAELTEVSQALKFLKSVEKTPAGPRPRVTASGSEAMGATGPAGPFNPTGPSGPCANHLRVAFNKSGTLVTVPHTVPPDQIMNWLEQHERAEATAACWDMVNYYTNFRNKHLEEDAEGMASLAELYSVFLQFLERDYQKTSDKPTMATFRAQMEKALHGARFEGDVIHGWELNDAAGLPVSKIVDLVKIHQRASPDTQAQSDNAKFLAIIQECTSSMVKADLIPASYKAIVDAIIALIIALLL